MLPPILDNAMAAAVGDKVACQFPVRFEGSFEGDVGAVGPVGSVVALLPEDDAQPASMQSNVMPAEWHKLFKTESANLIYCHLRPQGPNLLRSGCRNFTVYRLVE
jgi:hypothetical protein